MGRTPPAPIAAIDVGSNTVHICVARRDASGRDLEILADESDLVRLGHGMAAAGALEPQRVERAIGALRQYITLAQMLNARTVLGIATEGVRAAANCADFVWRAQQETGIALHIITGEQEGALSYWGATSEEPSLDHTHAVIDLGGGSLEIAVGSGTRVLWRVSAPLGAGAVRDRYQLSNPPTLAELDHAYQEVQLTLAPTAAPMPVEEASVCGGTARALASIGTRLLGEGTARIALQDGHLTEIVGPRILTRYHLETILATLVRLPAARIAAQYGVKLPRARLLASGCISLLAAMRHLRVSRMRVSQRGLREGAMLAYWHTGEGWLEAATSGQGWPTRAR